MAKKALPIGVDDFADMINDAHFYLQDNVYQRTAGSERKGKLIHPSQTVWEDIKLKHAPILFRRYGKRGQC